MSKKEYINSLERITIKDIPNIIKEDINKEGDYVAYGFRMDDEKNILFGKYYEGILFGQYLLTFENIDSLCEELDMKLKSQFPNTFSYGYSKGIVGWHEYYGYANNLQIGFPNFSQKNENWIIKQVDNIFDKKTRKLQN